MDTKPLSSGAEACIKVMFLAPKREDLVRTCISRYTTPPTFPEVLHWRVYRIFNAIKSLFGMSDWQIARNAIRDNATEIALERGLIQARPEDRAHQRIKEQAIELFTTTASELMSHCLDVNQLSLSSDPELRALLDKVGLENVLKQLKETVDKVFKNSPKAA